jgi:peptidoglycan/LPS O-acetylase OafA/YrhL
MNFNNLTGHSELSAMRPNLDYIDMLRGLAIIGVLLAHSGYGMTAAMLREMPLHLDTIFSAGRHGVTLFFVVSAFTLTRSISLRHDVERQALRNYFLRRFFRIAPAYYVVLLAVFFGYGKGVAQYTNPLDEQLTWVNLAAHFTFLNGFFPFYTNDFLGVEWSVSTEFMFYLLLPAIYLWITGSTSRRSQLLRALLLYSGALLASWLMFFKGGYLQRLGGGFSSPVFGPWIYFFLGTHLNAFMAGIVAWLVMPPQKKEDPFQQAPISVYLLLVTLVVIAIYATFFEARNFDNATVIWLSVIFWGLAAAAFTLVLNTIGPRRRGLLTFLSTIGKVSFSLYLVHFPIFTGLSKFAHVWSVSQSPLLNYLIYLVLAFGGSVAVAWGMYQFIELRGIELGKKFIGY